MTGQKKAARRRVEKGVPLYECKQASSMSPAQLREIIEGSGLSQRDFAEKIGKSRQIISLWLNGSVAIQKFNAAAIRAIFPKA